MNLAELSRMYGHDAFSGVTDYNSSYPDFKDQTLFQKSFNLVRQKRLTQKCILAETFNSEMNKLLLWISRRQQQKQWSFLNENVSVKTSKQKRMAVTLAMEGLCLQIMSVYECVWVFACIAGVCFGVASTLLRCKQQNLICGFKVERRESVV